MNDYEDITAWLDKPFRMYIHVLPKWPFPRPSILKDRFFDQKLGDILSSSDDELQSQTQYISGLGPMGEKALFQLIATLRVDRQI